MGKTPSGATTPGQSGSRSDGNEGVLHIPPKLQHYWNITIIVFSVISRVLLRRSLTSAEVPSVYFTAPDDWAKETMMRKTRQGGKDNINGHHQTEMKEKNENKNFISRYKLFEINSKEEISSNKLILRLSLL